jgi:hypothetical protein
VYQYRVFVPLEGGAVTPPGMGPLVGSARWVREWRGRVIR